MLSAKPGRGPSLNGYNAFVEQDEPPHGPRKFDGEYCPYCGKKAEDNFDYCPKCGEDI